MADTRPTTTDRPAPLPEHGRIRQVARWLGVSERAIRRWVRTGVLPIYRPAGSWGLVSVDAARRLLAAERAPVVPETIAEAEHIAAILGRRRSEAAERSFRRVRAEIEAGE